MSNITNRERAELVFNTLGTHLLDSTALEAIDYIAAQLSEAVAEEREACAKVAERGNIPASADDFDKADLYVNQEIRRIAAAIRSQKGQL